MISPKTPVRILMIVENCPFLRDPRVHNEATTLHSAGHRVSVICPSAGQRQPLRECINGVTVYRFRPVPAGLKTLGYLFEYAYATLAIAVLSVIVLAREGFDVIHVANPPDTLVLTVAVFKLIGRRIIYDQHDLCPELFSAKFTRFRWLRRVLLWLESCSYGLADHIITTNESYKKVALARGRIPETKITVVRNGPALTSIRSTTIDNDRRRKSNNVIVYAGTIGSQDRLDCLCRILHRLRYDLAREDFSCVVIGDGDVLPEIKDLVQSLELNDKVYFTGWVDDYEKYLQCLNSADICVSSEPSTTYNNQSTFIKIIEYMAAGKPIVAFNLSETRYSAQDSALYADDERQFAVHLAELMDLPHLRNKLGRRGQERVRKELAWQYSIPHLLSAYSACLNGMTQRRCSADKNDLLIDNLVGTEKTVP
jgi:glycosyltransferase involved in cell wall biosynthesis